MAYIDMVTKIFSESNIGRWFFQLLCRVRLSASPFAHFRTPDDGHLNCLYLGNLVAAAKHTS